MANELFNYCLTKPYFRKPMGYFDTYWTVKKTVLNYALDTLGDMDAMMKEVETVTKMFLARYKRMRREVD